MFYDITEIQFLWIVYSHSEYIMDQSACCYVMTTSEIGQWMITEKMAYQEWYEFYVVLTIILCSLES